MKGDGRVIRQGDGENMPWTKWAEYMLTKGISPKSIPPEAFDEDPPEFIRKAVISNDPIIGKIKLLLGENDLIKELSPLMDCKTLRRFIQACHPDKHNSSALAIEVTQWLNAKKD